MKLTSYLFKAFALLLALVIVACKHEPPAEPFDCGEATTIDEMMEWTFFKTGTYWIYKEVNSGALDTCTVYYDYSGVSGLGHREFEYRVRSSYDGFTYAYWFNDGWSGYGSLTPQCFIRVVDCDKFVPGDYRGGAHVFPFPLFVGNRCHQEVGLSSGLSEIINRLEHDTIQGQVFSDVYVLSQRYSPQHDWNPSVYKLSKHIGIIQKKIDHTQEDWQLIENLILQ